MEREQSRSTLTFGFTRASLGEFEQARPIIELL